MRVAAFMIFALLTTPAAAADQFDLVCKGQKNFGPASRRQDDRHYRIDLVAGKWCAGACSVQGNIFSATPGAIVLQKRDAAYRGDTEIAHTVDRRTGVWRDHFASDGADYTTEGTCEPAAFSGFPPLATKF